MRIVVGQILDVQHSKISQGEQMTQDLHASVEQYVGVLDQNATQALPITRYEPSSLYGVLLRVQVVMFFGSNG